MEKLRPTPKPRPKKRPRPNEKNVIVEMPTGDRLDWMVVEPCTIENVKELVFQYEGIPVEMQHLVIEAPNDCTISNPVNPNDSSIHFILMPMYYNFQAKEKAVQIKGHTSDEEGEGEEEEEDENEEEKEEEDAKEEEESSKRLKIGVLEEG